MTFESMRWLVTEGEYEGYTTSIRYALVPRDFPRTKYPIHLNITWSMYEPDEYGFPSETESQRLEIFEEFLVQAVERDEHSIFDCGAHLQWKTRICFSDCRQNWISKALDKHSP
jgi:hypothetical protein